MKRIVLMIFAGLLFLAGFAVTIYPFAENFIFERENHSEISRFCSESSSLAADGNGSDDTVSSENTRILAAMQSYNERIFREGQAGMTDAWSDVDDSFDFSETGLEDEMIGYIAIPAMDVELPLYIGADQEHLGRGAAVLAQTSMPVGGENSNCVIAAHRGYGGKAMFREIEELVPGDLVEITNLWETLSYEVVKCIVIDPDNIEAVQIIPGEDMVTLVTCHPYTKNYQRYVVYCRRADSGQEEEGSGGGTGEETDHAGEGLQIPYDGVEYESSVPEIRRERLLSCAGPLALIAVLAAALLFLLRDRNSRRKGEKCGKSGRRRRYWKRKKRTEGTG